MMLEQERQDVIDHCLRMLEQRLTLGTSGNVSVRVGDRIAISPSGIDYHALTPDMVPVVDLDGALIEGTRSPSSELPMHLLIYRESDARAVIHTHPVYGTVVGTLVDETPLIHYMLAPCGGPVRVAPYATFGSDELAENVRRAMVGRTAVLLRNHGATCWGATLAEALNTAGYLEWVCEVYVKARSIGDPSLITPGQLDEVIHKIAATGYGKQSPSA